MKLRLDIHHAGLASRGFALGRGAPAFTCLGLGACAFKLDYPLATEAVLVTSEHKGFDLLAG